MTSNPNKFVSIDAGSTREDAPEDYFTGEYQHLPASRQRKQNLLTYAKHNTKADNIRIDLSESADTASIQNYGEEKDGAVLITIPVDREVENPYVDIDDSEFYSMLQYAWTLHETGHYLYTDQPTVDERMEQFEEMLREYPRQLQGIGAQLGKNVWNAIEDGAMEEAVKNEKGPKAGQRLAVKNESFIAQGSSGADDTTRSNITVLDAIQMAAMDLAKYDTGTLRRLLDDTDDSWEFASEEERERFENDILPLLQNGIIDAFTTASSVERQHVIWDLVEDLIETVFDEMEQDQVDEPDSPFGDAGDDTENESGPAQKQQSPGLKQNSKQQVAQQQANTTQQTVVIESEDGEEGGESGEDEDAQAQEGDEGDGESDAETGDDGDGESMSGSDGEDSGSTDGDGEEQSGADGSDSDSGEQSSGDGDVGATEHGAGGADGDDETITCPQCGDDDVGRKTITTDGMVAARVNAPFSIDASWIDSISFVSNDEVCGFRVRTSGAVPVDSIEQQGYIVADIDNNTVEILEPADQYGDTENVNGFECANCGNTWVPVIGGDSQ